MRVMVTGGAGYIGSVITTRLLEGGHDVTVYDDLSRGHLAAVPAGASLMVGDIRDTGLLRDVMANTQCEAVIHMAALAEVAESVKEPDRYADVNFNGTQALVEAALAAGVARIVFSSTAAVYGEPERVPVEEDAPLRPTNPYGQTKLAAVTILLEAAAASGGRLSAVALRYFNAAGADGERGEDHEPETHLVPIALRAARDGMRLRVFGDDYPTPDGTCVRDYVHVLDLADAHIAALDKLPDAAGAYNLGTGAGNSVLDVVRAVTEVTGLPLGHVIAPRRPGDPAVLVASYAAAAKAFDWRPRRSLRRIVDDAWAWLRENPKGYGDREP